MAERITVRFAGETVADTTEACRVLETSHPPVYYLPPNDIRMDLVIAAPGRSFCELKGYASYVTLVANGRRSESAGWYYANPTKAFDTPVG